jgi:hypothetical protein
LVLIRPLQRLLLTLPEGTPLALELVVVGLLVVLLQRLRLMLIAPLALPHRSLRLSCTPTFSICILNCRLLLAQSLLRRFQSYRNTLSQG